MRVPIWLRAASFFIIAPGSILGLLPWRIGGGVRPRVGVVGEIAAVALFLIGLSVLLWCFREFATRGQGTPAPYDPPRKLVVQGLYRFTRNPMYVGIMIALIGESIWRWSSSLAMYTAVVAVGFHLRVLIYEEPKLTKLFGAEFAEYRTRVPRWI